MVIFLYVALCALLFWLKAWSPKKVKKNMDPAAFYKQTYSWLERFSDKTALSLIWLVEHLTSKHTTGVYLGLFLLATGIGAYTAGVAAVAWMILWYMYDKRMFLDEMTFKESPEAEDEGVNKDAFLYRVTARAASRQGSLNWILHARVYGAVVGFMYMIAFGPLLTALAPLLMLKGFVWQEAKTDGVASLVFGTIFGLATAGKYMGVI